MNMCCCRLDMCRCLFAVIFRCRTCTAQRMSRLELASMAGVMQGADGLCLPSTRQKKIGRVCVCAFGLFALLERALHACASTKRFSRSRANCSPSRALQCMLAMCLITMPIVLLRALCVCVCSSAASREQNVCYRIVARA